MASTDESQRAIAGAKHNILIANFEWTQAVRRDDMRVARAARRRLVEATTALKNAMKATNGTV